MKRTFLILTFLSLTFLTACNNNWTGFYYSVSDQVEMKSFRTEEECQQWAQEKLIASKEEDAYECKPSTTL